MSDHLESVIETIPEFKNEAIAIQTSIQSLIINNKIAKPFFIPIDHDDKKPFVSFIRDWNVDNHLDYFAAISEMLFAFSSFNSKAFLLAVHPESNPFFNANNQFDFAKNDNLVIFVISSDIAIAVEMTYTIDSNSQKIVWSDEFTCTEIVDIQDPIVECLYMYSHIDTPPFTYKEVLNFLSNHNTNLMIADDEAKINKFYGIQKGPYAPSLMV